MKIIFTCHTEYDLNNKKGELSFDHVPFLVEFIGNLKVPVTFSLMVGGQIGDNLLKFIERKNIKFPPDCEKSIHYHGKISFKPGCTEEFLDEKEIINYFRIFNQAINTRPISVVFGKWFINQEAFPVLQRLGIKVDGSWTGKFIIKSPFYLNNILEVPVICDGRGPANPLTRLSNFFLIRKIIKKHHQKNFILHIAFHSYDFFRFNKEPKMRLIKKLIFKNILKLAQKHKLEIINLSEIKTVDFQNLDYLEMPFFSKIFRLFGH